MVEQDSGRIAAPALDTRGVSEPAKLAGAPGRSRRKWSLLRWGPRNWRVRWRVLALVLIPSVAAIALGVVRIQTAQNTANNAADIQQLSTIGGAITSLAESIQDERTLSAGFATARESGDAPEMTALLGQLNAQEAVTNARVTTVQRLAGQIGTGFPAVARTDLTLAVSSLGALDELRTLAQGQGSEMSAVPLIQHYSSVISQLLAFDDDIAAGSSSAQLAQTVTSLNALAQAEEQASQQEGTLYAILLGGQLEQGALSTFTAAQSSQASDLDSFQSVATTLQAYVPGSGLSPSLTENQQYNDTVVGPQVDEALDIGLDVITAASTGQRLAGSSSQAQQWFSDMQATVNDMRTVESDALSSITAQASSLRQGAKSSETLTAILVIILLVVVLAVSIILARSMVRPLRKLREDALDIAGRRLPKMVQLLSESQESDQDMAVAPIGIDSSDEIGEVARAFDQVHREAVRLAGNEAILRTNLNAMFVNLSRRSQSLIERQLGIIDSLEQSEQDPDRLSSLFRLDHLATRMRRNSENLLVLAGQDASRKRSQAVPLVDVMRAAVSEIEQYERVVLNIQPGVMVAGRAVSDVVHLAAELVENATAFSPEESQVLVVGQTLSSGGVLIQITDSGVGIPEAELAHANWRLDNPPVVDVAVSRRMGLFVVGRLAARHGVRVRLQLARGSGLTALIWLPTEVAEPEPTPALGTLRRRFDVDGYKRSMDGPQPQSIGPAFGRRETWVAPFSAPAAPVAAAIPTSASARPTDFTGSRAGVGRGTGETPVLAPTVQIPAVVEPMPIPSPQPVPAPQPQVESRLPIYDSVESDWFRRSGKTLSDGASASPAPSVWTSPADAGWRAAEVVVAPTAADHQTQAGLPKRVPKANLVPGSVGSTVTGGPGSARSPETVRDRMTGLQRGLREGRAAAPRETEDR